jgi:hypothetical protein
MKKIVQKSGSLPYLIRNIGIEQIVKHSIYSQVPERQIYAARTAY